MTSDFLLLIPPGWVVMFLNSNRTVLTLRSWLYVLVVVLAFWISILKNLKSLKKYWHSVTDITSFEKHLENSLGHTLSFCPIWLNIVSRICCWRNRSSVFYGNLDYKLKRVKGTAYFVLSGSEIVKRLRRRKYDPVVIERTIGACALPFYSLAKDS